MKPNSTSATMLTFEFPPCNGGVSRFCGALAKGLQARGVEVNLVTDARWSGQTTETPDSMVGFGPGRAGRDPGALWHLRRHKHEGPTICALWYPEGLIATLAGCRRRVILAHGAELMPARSPLREPVWNRLRRGICESAELVVANSEYTKRLVLRSAPNARVVALPLGVDHEKFKPASSAAAKARFEVAGKTVISSVSRLQAFKGHRTVLNALAALSDTHRDRFVYLIAGAGPDRQTLERFVADKGLSSQVRFLGFVADDDLPDVYRASDLFVLCTQEVGQRREVEGFGLVFLEAQACGTPVVGTRTGGIPDAIADGDGGWLIAQDDAAELTRILRQLIGEPEYFRAAGLAARARVERECTWEHYTRQFMDALQVNGVCKR